MIGMKVLNLAKHANVWLVALVQYIPVGDGDGGGIVGVICSGSGCNGDVRVVMVVVALAVVRVAVVISVISDF